MDRQIDREIDKEHLEWLVSEKYIEYESDRFEWKINHY
jgi:hypothetical protein